MDTAVVITQSLLGPLVINLGIVLVNIDILHLIDKTGVGESVIEDGQVGVLLDKTGKELV